MLVTKDRDPASYGVCAAWERRWHCRSSTVWSPALTALARTPAVPTKRLGVVVVPNGAPAEYWTPKDGGSRLRVGRRAWRR